MIQTISADVKDANKHWNDLVFNVCNGDAGQMNEIMKFDVFDFFNYIDNMKGK